MPLTHEYVGIAFVADLDPPNALIVAMRLHFKGTAIRQSKAL